MRAQSPHPGGASLSIQPKTDANVSFSDTLCQPVLPFMRSDVGYSAIRPLSQIGMVALAVGGAEVARAFTPFQGVSPIEAFMGTGMAMALKQRRRCWKDLGAGVLRNPYSRGESRVYGLLLRHLQRKGVPFFKEGWVRRWIDPLAVAACGGLLLHFGFATALGMYLIVAGICLRIVEASLYRKEKEMYLNGVAALANAHTQSSTAQRFHDGPTPERKSEAPAAGLSTGIGSDLAAKVEALKAKTKREGGRIPPGGGIAAVALLAVMLPGMSRAADAPAASASAASAGPVEKTVLLTPLAEGVFVTSSDFGMRMNPIFKVVMFHAGIDLAAPSGTPIQAAADGVVEAAGLYGCDGNYVRLRHDGGVMTSYSHASRIAPGIISGARVRQGQVIAWVGSTGCSTGPHLHYQVWVNGAKVNPALVCHLLALSSGCYYFPPPGEPRRKTAG